jgi:hypothetical protein
MVSSPFEYHEEESLIFFKGYTTFKPAFEELELEKLKKAYVEISVKGIQMDADDTMIRERDAADLGPNMIEVPTQKMEPGAVAQAVKSDRSQRING